MKFSVCIITYNETISIARCLNSVEKFSDDIVVIDSFSSDGTKELIQRDFPNVRLVEKKWAGFAEQRNTVLNLPLRNDFILFLDADEELDTDFVRELEIKASDEYCVRVFHTNFFLGKFLRHQRECKVGQVRFGHVSKIRFVAKGHGQYVADNVQVVNMERTYLKHYPFDKGLDHWLARHNGYALAEINSLTERKKLVYQLPFFPVLIFLWELCFRSVWKDGYRGVFYLMLKISYYRQIRLRYLYERFRY